MRKQIIWSAAATLALGGEALAGGMSYNYVQGQLLGTELHSGGASEDGFGFGFEGAVEMNRYLHGRVELGAIQYKADGTSLTFKTGSLGLGGKVPLRSTLDLVFVPSFERVTAKVSDEDLGGSVTFDGWGFGVGLRGQLDNGLQWMAGLKYRHIEDLQSILSGTLGGRYYLTPRFALGLELTGNRYDKDTLDFSESIAALTLRYDFGRRE